MKIPLIVQENEQFKKTYIAFNDILFKQVSNECFPVIKDGFGLHKYPFGATLIYIGNPVLQVNETGRDILLLINGQRSLFDICEEITKNKSLISCNLTIVKSFLVNLVFKGVLSCYNEKHHSATTITGSLDHVLPFHATLELTARCDLRCLHCYAEANPNRNACDELEIKEWLNIIDELSEGCADLSLTGGDPLVYENYKEIVEYSIFKGLPTSIFTNGVRVTDEVADWMKKVGVSTVKLSLDGPNAKIHDKLRNYEGAFDATLMAIERLVDRGIKVTVGTTVYKENVDFISDIVQLAYDKGVSSVGIGRVVEVGRARYNLAKIQEYNLYKVIENVDKAMRKISDPNFRVSFEEDGNWAMEFNSKMPTIEEFLNYRNENCKSWFGGCGAGFRYICISNKGEVRPCLLSNVIMGKISKDTTLINIMEGEFANAFRNLPVPDIEVCNTCGNLSVCLGCVSKGIVLSYGIECKWKDIICKQTKRIHEIFIE